MKTDGEGSLALFLLNSWLNWGAVRIRNIKIKMQREKLAGISPSTPLLQLNFQAANRPPGPRSGTLRRGTAAGHRKPGSGMGRGRLQPSPLGCSPVPLRAQCLDGEIKSHQKPGRRVAHFIDAPWTAAKLLLCCRRQKTMQAAQLLSGQGVHWLAPALGLGALGLRGPGH